MATKGGRKRKSGKNTARRNLLISILAIVFVFAGTVTANSVAMLSDSIPTWNSLFSTDTQNAPTVVVDGNMQVSVIDIGQGSSALVSTADKNILIDGGESSEAPKLIAYLESCGVETIDIIIATHQHADHIGGLSDVIDKYEVERIIMPKLPDSLVPTSKTYENLLLTISEHNLKITSANVGDSYDFGDMVVEILGPTEQFDDLNNMSVITKVTFGESEFLFCGDAERQAEQSVISSGADIDCDVLIVGHHGSNTSTTEEFAEKTTPDFAAISCGEGNSYGHPHEEVLRVLQQSGAEIYRTDLMGTTLFETDGRDISVSYEKQ